MSHCALYTFWWFFSWALLSGTVTFLLFRFSDSQLDRTMANKGFVHTYSGSNESQTKAVVEGVALNNEGQRLLQAKNFAAAEKLFLEAIRLKVAGFGEISVQVCISQPYRAGRYLPRVGGPGASQAGAG